MFAELVKIFREIRNKTKDTFSIEYHAINNRYYPKLGNMFMIRNNLNNKIDLVERYMYHYSIFFNSKEEAVYSIEKYKKQQDLEKIETIQLD